MHLLRVSPSQRSGSSAGSGLGGSTFLCTGRLLGTGDPQGKQRYWGSWEAAKGSELGRCEGLLTSFCTAHSRQGQGHGQGQELPALLPPAEEGVCIAGVGKRVLWGLSPSCLGHNGITASWGKPLPVLPALLLHPQQQIWAGMRRRSGIWEVDEKPHLHIAELPGDCGEQSSSHHGSVARRCLPGWPGMPLWPPGVRLAILGQGRAFLHTYLEGQQCRLWLPPSPPASSPPLSCPRRAALALAYSAQTCPNPAQRRQAGSLPLLAPAGRAMSVAGGVRASHGPAGKSSSVAGWDEGHGACLCPLPEEGVLSAAMGGPDPCAPQPGVTVLGSPRG